MKELPRNLTGTAYQTPYGDDQPEPPEEQLCFSHADLREYDGCGGTFYKRDIHTGKGVEEFFCCDECRMLMTEQELITLAVETYGHDWEKHCKYQPELVDESWDY